MTNSATLTKTQNAQTAGAYSSTMLDEHKSLVDFRLVQVGPNVIRWIDGRSEVVTSRRLATLQKNFSWKTDF